MINNVPKSKARKSTAKRKKPGIEWVTIEYDGVAPHLRNEFESRDLPILPTLRREPGLLRRRVRSVQKIIGDIVPPRTRVRVCVTADMASTLAKVAPERFGDSSRSYTRERGANKAAAKTIVSADGTFDILIDLARFCSFYDDDDEAATDTATLEHLAAHEPQHILMHLSRTDSTYLPLTGESPTVNDLVPLVAEAVDEFRCELAANRIVVSGLPQDQTIGDDLDHFREALNASVALSSEDRWAACVKTMTAVKELLKALGYLAALHLADSGDAARPVPASDEWDRYLGSLWPDFFSLLSTVPASDEEADCDALASAIYLGASRVSVWLDEIGVTYRSDSSGERAILWRDDSRF